MDAPRDRRRHTFVVRHEVGASQVAQLHTMFQDALKAVRLLHLPAIIAANVARGHQSVQSVVIVESKSTGMKDKNDVFKVLAIEAANEANLRSCEELGHKVTT